MQGILSDNLFDAYVETVTHAMRSFAATSREEAAEALRAWPLRHGLTPEIITAVLDRFDGPATAVHETPMVRIAAAEDFGPVLRQLRQEAGLSLDRTSARCGVSAVWLGAIERGDRTPHTPRLVDALRGYGCQLAVVRL